MYTSGTVAARQLFHFGHSDEVVVALDGVLQGGSRHRKLHRGLGVLAGQQGVDQAAAEAVAAADTVDDVQMIQLGEAVLILLSRSVMATISKLNLSASCLATLL